MTISARYTLRNYDRERRRRRTLAAIERHESSFSVERITTVVTPWCTDLDGNPVRWVYAEETRAR